MLDKDKDLVYDIYIITKVIKYNHGENAMQSYMVISTMNNLFEQLVRDQNYYAAKNEQAVKVFNNKEGIYFVVEVDSECYGYEKDGNTHHEEWEGRCYKLMHVLMIYPHFVFVCITDGRTFEIPQTGWKNTSNHSSCWRSGCDELTSLVFNCHNDAHKNVPKNDPRVRELRLSDDVNIRLRVSLSGRVFNFVEADWIYQEDGNHKDIKSVKRISKTITC